MIICSRCGNALTDGLQYCTECGTSVPVFPTTVVQPTGPAFAQSQPVAPSRPESEQNSTVRSEGKTNPLPWIITAVAILVTAIVIIYTGSKSNSSPSSQNADYGISRTSNSSQDRENVNNSNANRNANTYATSSAGNMNTRQSAASPSTTRTLAYCNANTLNVRSSPVLDSDKTNYLGELTRGDEVWILRESSNYDTYNGVTSNWAEIQMVNGSLRGWVFRYYLAIADGAD